MRYTIQINTGTFLHHVTNRAEMLTKVNYCLDKLDVDKAIFGWSPNSAINEALVELLDQRGIEKYFWLPVFSDVGDISVYDHSQDIRGRSDATIKIIEGETFDFVCQSSSTNISNAIRAYDELTAGLNIDGVFIDRIRYASAANSTASLYGCWCPRCRANYVKANIDLEYLEVLAGTDDVTKFVPDSLADACYHFTDTDIDKLFTVKRNTITRAVEGLCEAFRLRKLKVGIDTFAPVLADFVGQDSVALGQQADFVKPMVYLRTHAPAGIPYEVEALGSEIGCRLNELWSDDVLQIEAVEKSIFAFSSKGIVAVPGIDVNRIKGICDATPKYAVDYMNRIEQAGYQSVVLSWDALRISEDMIDAIARR